VTVPLHTPVSGGGGRGGAGRLRPVSVLPLGHALLVVRVDCADVERVCAVRFMRRNGCFSFYLRLSNFCFNVLFLGLTFFFLLLQHFRVLLKSFAFSRKIRYASQAIDCVILVLPFHVRRLKKFMQVPSH
jgi:hypothetical protein